MFVKILLTGGTGFVGARLRTFLLLNPNVELTCAVRKDTKAGGCEILVGDLGPCTDWSNAVHEQHVIVHVAARAHVQKGSPDAQLAEYRKVNVEGTVNLARQAASAGAQRFVFISSIGVNGDANSQPFTERDAPHPVGAYAQSKMEAEEELWGIHKSTGMEVVIIRPPLVYGPLAPGNFGALLRWLRAGVPLPLGAVHNTRSLVALDNLVDLISRCIEHPTAANQVFLAGDGEDLSTTELLQRVAKAMGKPSRLIPLPVGLLMFGATVLGKKAMAQRLLGSLQVDISKARNLLGWEPPLSVEQGLKRCFPDR